RCLQYCCSCRQCAGGPAGAAVKQADFLDIACPADPWTPAGGAGLHFGGAPGAGTGGSATPRCVGRISRKPLWAGSGGGPPPKAGRMELARTLLDTHRDEDKSPQREAPEPPRWSSLSSCTAEDLPAALFFASAPAGGSGHSHRLSSMPWATGERRFFASSRALGASMMCSSGPVTSLPRPDGCRAEMRAILFSTVKPRLIFCRGARFCSIERARYWPNRL